MNTNYTPAPPSSPPAAPSSPRRFSFVKVLLGSVVAACVAAVVVVALAPSLLEWSATLRNRALGVLVGDVNGEVTVDSLSAGWFEPVVLRGVRVRHPSGESIIDIDRVESDRVLWRMASTPDDLGTFRIERPIVHAALREGGNNFYDVFEPLTRKPKPPKGLHLGGRIRIVGGTFHCRSNEYAEPWQLDDINFGVGWQPGSRSPSGKPELLVERGTLLSRTPLSVGLCTDLLSFVAPVLNRIAHVQGSVTIELDDWRLPWDEFAAGELAGRVKMHTVDAAPGPLVRSLHDDLLQVPIISRWAATRPLPQAVELARESTVSFEMIEGRIHHEGLQFSIAGLVEVGTHGAVGLDKELNLRAQLAFHPPNAAEAPFAIVRAVSTQVWPVNIRGRLGAPQIDLSPLKLAGAELARTWLDDVRSGRPSVAADGFRVMDDLGIPIGPNEVQRLLQLVRPPENRVPVPEGPTLRGPGDANMAAAPPSFTPPSVTLPRPQTPGATQPSRTYPSGGSPPPLPTPPVAPIPQSALPPGGMPPAGLPPLVPPANGQAEDLPLPDPNTPAPLAGPNGTVAAEPSIATQVTEGVGLAIDVLQGLRQRREAALREQALREQAAAAERGMPPPPGSTSPGGIAPPPGAPPAPLPTPPPRRPLLREGLRLLLDAAEERNLPPPPAAAPTATR